MELVVVSAADTLLSRYWEVFPASSGAHNTDALETNQYHVSAFL